MTEVSFYTFAEDPLDIARRIATKAFARGQQVMLYAPDADVAATLDRLLWTTPAHRFVPHCRDSDALAGETPVLIGTNPDALGRADILINLGPTQPPGYARYERLIEIVGQDDDARQRGRKRYRFYQARGYALHTHDLRTRQENQ